MKLPRTAACTSVPLGGHDRGDDRLGSRVGWRRDPLTRNPSRPTSAIQHVHAR
jgi:hypothetical protein